MRLIMVYSQEAFVTVTAIVLGLDEEDRSRILSDFERARQHIVLILEGKFKCFNNCPFKFCSMGPPRRLAI